MSQVSERDRVKERMKKILERVNHSSTSEAEAVDLMDKFEQLSRQYDITMSEIDLREEPCLEIQIDTGTKKRDQMDYVAVAIARLCSVRCWSSGGGKNVSDNRLLHFFGMQSDLDRVKYYYELIRSAMNTERDRYMANFADRMQRGQKRSMRSNFQDGFAGRMCVRLKKMKEERDAEILAMQSTGRSLVLVKEQVVEDEFSKKKMKLSAAPKYYHHRKHNVDANIAGQDAAGNVDITTSITAQNGRNKLYLS